MTVELLNETNVSPLHFKQTQTEWEDMAAFARIVLRAQQDGLKLSFVGPPVERIE